VRPKAGGYRRNKDAIIAKLKGAKINMGSGTGADLSNAVLQWQKKYNTKYKGTIKEDGIIGNQTLTALGIKAFKPQSSPGRSGGGLPASKSAVNVTATSSGNRIRRLGYAAKLGLKNQQQVIDWQSKHGLEPDGIIGPKTAQAMYNALH
jgi:peptidoglycan hydrolase-like protein with peptidoglycan-binding domain